MNKPVISKYRFGILLLAAVVVTTIQFKAAETKPAKNAGKSAAATSALARKATPGLLQTDNETTAHEVGQDLCAKAGIAPTAFPLCAPLPLMVHTSIVINSIDKVDETNMAMGLRFDLRLQWVDPRNAFSAQKTGVLRKDWASSEAAGHAAKIWLPPIGFEGAVSEMKTEDSFLSIYADGTTVWNRRMAGEFETNLDLNEFPFDAQALEINLGAPSLPSRLMVFEHQDQDRRLTALRPGVNTPVWTFSNLTLETGARRMINGEKTSTVSIGFTADRLAMPYVPPLFLPLIVTVFLPILALWIIDTDVHERVNWVLTGVFALIALNFSVTLQYPMLGPDSTVMQFFWIGYALQLIVFMVILTLYNESVAERLMSEHMRETLLSWLRWSLPAATSVIMAYSMLLAAS